MTKIALAICSTVAAALIVGSAFAGTDDPRILRRESRQSQRIDQGSQNSALTSQETARLEAQQAKIKQEEELMKSDGNLTKAERAKLTRDQNRASRTVYRKTHNARTAAVQ
jgi:hypothetical protein